MLFDFLFDALTFLTAPRKRYCLAVQAEQIIHNRQPHPSTIMKINTNITSMVQETPSPQSSTRSKHTGFHEPLSPHRNTTLPHPDADTSENATLEATDLPLEKLHSRRHLLHHRNHSSRSGKITPEDSLWYDNIQYSDGTKEKSDPAVIEEALQKRDDVIDAPSESREVGSDSFSSQEKRNPKAYRDGEKKRGVLRKLRFR